MGRRWVWAAVVVVALTAAVLALRAPPPPGTERVERVTAAATGWRLVPAPEGAEPRRVFADGDRVVVADGMLESRSVERNGGVLSIVEQKAGARVSSSGHPVSGPFVVTSRALAFQDGLRCLEFVDPGDLERRSRHCAPDGSEISLLSAEPGGPQWREVGPAESCAAWFRLGGDGTTQRLTVGEPACRSALLVRTGGWELTADFPPYQVGVAYPGPLVARRGSREIILDSSVVDVRVCGIDVYWLSGAGGLVRWRPGEGRADARELAGARSLRCVNGALNVVAPTGVWLPGQR